MATTAGAHQSSAGTGAAPGRYALRRPLDPWSGRSAVEPAEVAALWSRLLTTPPARRKRLAYVHVPFCANHCLFCGFYRGPASAERIRDYVALPIAELEREHGAPAVAQAPVHAVYLGGGTPTSLPASDLHRLLDALRTRLPLAPDCEITVEGRWLGFDDEKIDACLDAGANRFSIGVQSFDTEVRQRQGRRASREQLERFLVALRDRERAALVVDLLFGLPGQTRTVWEQDLERCLALEPDGADLYCLNVYPGTPLGRAVAAGRVPPGADLAEQEWMYRTGTERLGDAGWHQISNSHWARSTRERNLYNLLIKAGADCLAYGAGAGGSLGRHGYSLETDLERYRARVEAGEKPLAAIREAGPLQDLEARVRGGLEAGRLDLAALGPEPCARLTARTAGWRAAGLLESEAPVLRLSTAGRFWAPNLARDLLEALAELQGGTTR